MSEDQSGGIAQPDPELSAANQDEMEHEYKSAEPIDWTNPRRSMQPPLDRS